MLPDNPFSSENVMTLPADVHLHLPLIMPINNNLNSNLINSNNHNHQVQLLQILPGIYLTNNEFWTNERLRSHGFTHLIIIDKHIDTSVTNRFNSSSSNRNNNYNNTNNNGDKESSRALQQQQQQQQQHYYELLELNFGEESYLTTVLPNCYKAVKFIDKALQYDGTILVIDRHSHQKCLTIVTAYLMYKNNFNFNDAFKKIKQVYQAAELDRFFISQLYEYEPILQVQRAQSCGNSCSRELRVAYLKRKKLHDSPILIATTTTTTFTTTEEKGKASSLNYNSTTNSNNYHDFIDIIME